MSDNTKKTFLMEDKTENDLCFHFHVDFAYNSSEMRETEIMI